MLHSLKTPESSPDLVQVFLYNPSLIGTRRWGEDDCDCNASINCCQQSAFARKVKMTDEWLFVRLMREGIIEHADRDSLTCRKSG